MSAYLVVSPEGVVLYQDGLFDAASMDGPPTDPPVVEPNTAILLLEPFDWNSRPSDTSALLWNDGSAEWIETASMADLKAVKNTEIDLAREHANLTYFTFAGQRVRCDGLSWKDIISTNAEISLTREMPEGWIGWWKTMDRDQWDGVIFVAVPDLETWTAFIKAMVRRGLDHFGKAEGLKARLAAAQTAEEVALIKW